jgi:hypothetical protein
VIARGPKIKTEVNLARCLCEDPFNLSLALRIFPQDPRPDGVVRSRKMVAEDARTIDKKVSKVHAFDLSKANMHADDPFEKEQLKSNWVKLGDQRTSNTVCCCKFLLVEDVSGSWNRPVGAYIMDTP